MTTIRYMIRVDMDDVLKIEDSIFEFPWTETDWMKVLRQRQVVGMVIESRLSPENHEVVGYIVFELSNDCIKILNIGVKTHKQRKGYGTDLINKIADKMDRTGRTQALTYVRETNLPALMFFKARGFLSDGILKNQYEDTTEDAILMRFRVRKWANQA